MTPKCPQCGSDKINTYRMPTGPMWCDQCGFRVERKEDKPNPFYAEEGHPPQFSLSPNTR